MLLRDNQFQAIFLLPKVKIIQKKTHFKSHRFNQSATNIDRQSVCGNLLAGLVIWRENLYIITDDNLITIYLKLSQFYHDKSATKTGQKLNNLTKQTCEVSRISRKLDIRKSYEKSLKVSYLRGLCKKVVDPQRFELWEVLPSPVFKTGAIDQLSQRSTFVKKEVTIKFWRCHPDLNWG